jgi:glutamate-1-semialdehyde aminotransferase
MRHHYWPELRRLCGRYGTLLIADEIQTAWNRIGRWFATQHWQVVPDIVTVAKALGNGFPIAAYLTSDAVAAHYTRPGPRRSAAISCPAAPARWVPRLNLAGAYFLRAYAHEGKGDSARAKADYEKAVQLDATLDRK